MGVKKKVQCGGTIQTAFIIRDLKLWTKNKVKSFSGSSNLKSAIVTILSTYLV